MTSPFRNDEHPKAIGPAANSGVQAGMATLTSLVTGYLIARGVDPMTASGLVAVGAGLLGYLSSRLRAGMR